MNFSRPVIERAGAVTRGLESDKGCGLPDVEVQMSCDTGRSGVPEWDADDCDATQLTSAETGSRRAM